MYAAPDPASGDSPCPLASSADRRVGNRKARQDREICPYRRKDASWRQHFAEYRVETGRGGSLRKPGGGAVATLCRQPPLCKAKGGMYIRPFVGSTLVPWSVS